MTLQFVSYEMQYKQWNDGILTHVDNASAAKYWISTIWIWRVKMGLLNAANKIPLCLLATKLFQLDWTNCQKTIGYNSRFDDIRQQHYVCEF